jgi:hypothetical protein
MADEEAIQGRLRMFKNGINGENKPCKKYTEGAS